MEIELIDTSLYKTYLLWRDREGFRPHIHLGMVVKPWNDEHHARSQHPPQPAQSEHNQALPLGHLLEAEPQSDWEGEADADVTEPGGCGRQTSHHTQVCEFLLFPFITLKLNSCHIGNAV